MGELHGLVLVSEACEHVCCGVTVAHEERCPKLGGGTVGVRPEFREALLELLEALSRARELLLREGRAQVAWRGAHRVLEEHALVDARLRLDRLLAENARVHRDRPHVHCVIVHVVVIAAVAVLGVEERHAPLERKLAVLGDLGRVELCGLLPVDKNAHGVGGRVHGHGERVPLACFHTARVRVPEAVEGAGVAIRVDAELRLLLVLLGRRPLVPAGRAHHVTVCGLEELGVHAQREVVEVRAPTILAEWHTEHEERGRPRLDTRDASVAYEEPLASPLHPQGRSLLRAQSAARKVVKGGCARRARVHRLRAPRLAHPREVRVHQRRLELGVRIRHKLRLSLLQCRLCRALCLHRALEQGVQLRLSLGRHLGPAVPRARGRRARRAGPGALVR
mmetsp:Transcript_2905/g.8416  ORF Transcript_2905/g.8416 Transcript_2905/m.8416 type:complete len:393 (-) Transcript_2905:593-1771(-)